jgi:hypothetical protein
VTIHAYANNGMPQLRLGFPNGFTASLVVTGDGTVALAYWPTFDDESVDPKKFTEEQRAERQAAVVLGNQAASSVETMLFLQMVEALPLEECSDGEATKGSAGEPVGVRPRKARSKVPQSRAKKI